MSGKNEAPMSLNGLIRLHGGQPRNVVRGGPKPQEGSVVRLDVREQDATVDGAPIQGTFPVQVIRWIDITVYMVEAFKDAQGRIAPDALESLGAKGATMLEFMNAGIVVSEDSFELVMLHSMSLQPGRTEFWMFPKAVILGQQTIGRVRIEGNEIRVV